MIHKGKFLFLDRDGIINSSPIKGEYISNINEFNVDLKLFQYLSFLYKSNVKFAIVSNQRGVSLGATSISELLKMNLFLHRKSKIYDFKFEAISYCTHLISDDCNCRKPKAGMLVELMNKLNLKADSTFILGDQESDVASGKTAGIQTIHYNCTAQDCGCDYRISDFQQIVPVIENWSQNANQ